MLYIEYNRRDNYCKGRTWKDLIGMLAGHLYCPVRKDPGQDNTGASLPEGAGYASD